MTDLEIDKALALAIGWQQTYLSSQGICVYTGRYFDRVKSDGRWRDGMRLFSHRDWNVIGPIAKKFGLLVDFKTCVAWQPNMSVGKRGDTPQKAIALAVIHGANK